VRRDRLVDAPQEVVGATVADVAEVPFQLADGGVEVTVRAQVLAKPAVLGVQLDHRLRVVDRRLDLGPTANHGGVDEEPLDVSGAEPGDGWRVELTERLPDPVPF
jgi:hypothetical protein